MVWFPLALGAALLWSIGGVLVKKGYAAVSPLWNNLLNTVLGLLFWIPAALILNRFVMPVPGWEVVAAVAVAAGLYQFFYYCLSKGQLALTSTIIAGYPLFTILWSHLFLNERLAPWQYGGVVLILTGGVIVALPNKLKNSGSLSWALWGLLGAFCIGTGDFFSKFTVNRAGPYANLFYLALFNVLASGLNYLLDRNNRRMPVIFAKSFLPTFLGILVHLAGALCFLIAFGFGPASLISSVSSIYPAMLVLFAVRFLREKISLKQVLGIAAIVGGLVVIGIAGGKLT